MRSKLVWAGATAGTVIFTAVVLRLVYAYGDNEFWHVAVPGYLTGVGTIALALASFLLMRQEQADRRRIDAQAQAGRLGAELSEASRVIGIFYSDADDDGMRVELVNASSGPITEVRLLGASPPEDELGPETYGASFFDAADGGLERVLLSGATAHWPGRWNGITSRVLSVRIMVAFSWVDFHGNAWARVGLGPPVRLREPWQWQNDEFMDLRMRPWPPRIAERAALEPYPQQGSGVMPFRPL